MILTDIVNSIVAKKDSKPIWILFCIVLLGLGLRLINLGQQPFWGDELLSLDITTFLPDLGQLIEYLRSVEVHPPLFYLIQHFWIAWFGLSVFAIKMLSVLFGLGSIILSYFWGKIIFNSKQVGLLGALIVSVLPFQLAFSQEARPYIMLAFFGMAASLLLWQYQFSRKPIFLAGYALANLIGLYLHYSYLFVLVALAGWGLMEIYLNKEKRADQFFYWFLSHAAIVLGFSFWLTPFLFKFVIGLDSFFGLSRVPLFLRMPSFFGHIHDQLVWLTTASILPQIQIIAVFIAKILLITGFVWGFIRIYAKGHRAWRPVIFTIWLAEMPLILFFLSPASVPYTVIFERHISFVSIPLALLVAWIISGLSKKKALVVLIIFLASLIPYTTAVLGNDSFWDSNYNLAAVGEFINQNFEDGDIVVVALASVRTDLTHYLKDEIPVYNFLPINYYFNEYDTFATRHTLGLIENEFQSRVAIPTSDLTLMKTEKLVQLHSPKRVWLYAFGPTDYSIHAWFNARGWHQDFWNFTSLSRPGLYRYTSP
ncbi:MAG: hypothetical protein A3B10_02460 [Candidatus Doudnabacteria bacterium RIFCSPLOWO2_01_FULL_44_21]|uniref:Uncharacterized protein n=1 Tax=Candidatus Doudnabacteria bacterium RIFCSPLOWO2_01_FULL_44_21 TaxID=1817841 RepID=A0A1F5PXQ7_9BACT|nr:MAG: hypothetical protein A3B95_00990 [Candidatus Doudnabacteria bacterium RIFCSPHIGHO2_02_FULL_43_13b]OGE94492.1 MAG: hypothetical protein A3B10_02460 [Candidatus Doudnabacteria bacterium RIFCSPLOWO2_01_FULL_44_21]